jgi:hypothetical protein
MTFNLWPRLHGPSSDAARLVRFDVVPKEFLVAATPSRTFVLPSLLQPNTSHFQLDFQCECELYGVSNVVPCGAGSSADSPPQASRRGRAGVYLEGESRPRDLRELLAKRGSSETELARDSVVCSFSQSLACSSWCRSPARRKMADVHGRRLSKDRQQVCLLASKQLSEPLLAADCGRWPCQSCECCCWGNSSSLLCFFERAWSSGSQ